MTKIEEEILANVTSDFYAKYDATALPRGADTLIAQSAAEVAKRYIEKAIAYGENLGAIKAIHENHEDLIINKDEWLKENGIV